MRVRTCYLGGAEAGRGGGEAGRGGGEAGRGGREAGRGGGEGGRGGGVTGELGGGGGGGGGEGGPGSYLARWIRPSMWTVTGSRPEARKGELGHLQRMKRASTYAWQALH